MRSKRKQRRARGKAKERQARHLTAKVRVLSERVHREQQHVKQLHASLHNFRDGIETGMGAGYVEAIMHSAQREATMMIARELMNDPNISQKTRYIILQVADALSEDMMLTMDAAGMVQKRAHYFHDRNYGDVELSLEIPAITVRNRADSRTLHQVRL